MGLIASGAIIAFIGSFIILAVDNDGIDGGVFLESFLWTLVITFACFMISLMGGAMATSFEDAIVYDVTEEYILEDYEEGKYLVRDKRNFEAPYYDYKIINERGYVETKTIIEARVNIIETDETPRVEVIEPYFKNSLVRFICLNLNDDEKIFYLPADAILYENRLS